MNYSVPPMVSLGCMYLVTDLVQADLGSMTMVRAFGRLAVETAVACLALAFVDLFAMDWPAETSASVVALELYFVIGLGVEVAAFRFGMATDISKLISTNLK